MVWTNLWHTIAQWVTFHPAATYLLVFVVALCESLALVGLLIPGTVIMIFIGALAGSGAISVPFTLLTAMAGAVAGDGLSYWLGRRYHAGLKSFRLFHRYPQIWSRGEEFFRRHGGKSVFLGRFVGPVRPVIPVIAGMLDFPPGRFVVVNLLSAVGWALAYIVPGIMLAGSLTLIGAVSTRLSLLFLLLGLLLWLAFGLSRKAFNLLGRLGPKSEERLLPLLSLGLFAAGWVFFGVLEDLLAGDPLVQADQAVYHLLQTLRTPWSDQLLVMVTELGDGPVNIGIGATVLAVLVFQRRFRAAGFWTLAVGGGAGLILLTKWLLHRPRPIELYQGVSFWGFPSGHTAMCVVLFGFLAVLLVRGFSPNRRWIPFGLAVGMSLLIAFSRLYLGAHWLSDVLGGLSLGWAWVTFLGILYLHQAKDKPPRSLLLIAVLVAMTLTGSWHIHSRHAQDLARYRVQKPAQSLLTEDWQDHAWQQLPGRRIDLAGEKEEPLSLQWAGDPERLATRLIRQGWARADGFPLKAWLNFFIPQATIRQLPLLPLLENGRHERLLLSLDQDDRRLVLRLWPTEFHLAEGNRPLWVGSVTTERAYALADLITLPRQTGDYAAAQRLLLQALPPGMVLRQVQRPLPQAKGAPEWDGKTLLLTEGPLRSSGNGPPLPKIRDQYP